MRLKGKVVVVTASTRGIGLAIVKACAAEGAIVYMGARNLERAKEIADQLNAEGKKVRWVYNDATEDESYAAMIEEVVEKEGRIDVLVNNFGTSECETGSGFCTYGCRCIFKYSKYQFEERLSGKSGCGEAYGEERWGKYYQHFFYWRSDSGYFTGSIRNK